MANARATKKTKASTPKAQRSLRNAPLPPGDDVGAADLSRRVATNLKEKRASRALSLDQLAAASGVSRAALWQIETMKSNPSLSVLWKIAVGLGIPFAELIGGTASSVSVLRRGQSQALRSADGKMESYPLAPAGTSPWVEVYDLRLAARSSHAADPHAPGTTELVIVLTGILRLRLGADLHELGAGDSVSFRADQPHVYENSGNAEARYHNVIMYPR